MENVTTVSGGVSDTLYGGLNFSHLEDGGIECYKSMSINARILETAFIIPISCYYCLLGLKGLKKYKFSNKELNTKRILDSNRRSFYLIALALVWGIELGFKLSRKQEN